MDSITPVEFSDEKAERCCLVDNFVFGPNEDFSKIRYRQKLARPYFRRIFGTASGHENDWRIDRAFVEM